jgi:hypothetical protein
MFIEVKDKRTGTYGLNKNCKEYCSLKKKNIYKN